MSAVRRALARTPARDGLHARRRPAGGGRLRGHALSRLDPASSFRSAAAFLQRAMRFVPALRRSLLPLVLALATGLAAATATRAAEACAPGRVQLRGPQGSAAFSVDLAEDAATQARGLMQVESMPLSHGMLFVYDRAQPLSFWMRNTLIPLDMLFFDARGELVFLHPEAVPLDETPIRSPAPAQFVLEINGGLAARLGITPGWQLRHPKIAPAEALWPCNEG